MLRPVSALLAGTRSVSAGDLTTRIPVTARHELGQLAQAFNSMTQKLAETQRQLTQADKLASVGRLAAGVAHEINNPLTGILTYGSLLLKQAGTSPDTKSDLEVIVRETMRCRDIVKDLLDFARQTPPNRKPTDLNAVIRRAVAVVMNQLKFNRVDLRLDLSADLPPAAADANQMQQVLVNLLLNAADAVAGKQGGIRIASRRASVPARGHARIRVATCPRGCDLMDPAVRIGGLPSVLVLRSCRGRESPVHLDPVYGRLNHASPDPCVEGERASHRCPLCRVSLDLEDVRCGVCDEPALGVLVPGKGRVLWCSRVGCTWSSWETADAEGPRPVAELIVEDEGRGIAAADLPHLFEPFFTTKGTRGTGLGLAVTWGIVEGHGGTIVQSEDGEGTRFTVRLPLGAAETEMSHRAGMEALADAAHAATPNEASPESSPRTRAPAFESRASSCANRYAEEKRP